MKIAVVGGGIAGLSAALRLHDRLGGAAEITVLEGSPELGGKLRTGVIDDRLVETGAETFLAREADDPAGAPSAAVTLARRVGLGDALISPRTLSASILWDGRLAAMPAGTLMGVPAKLADVGWAPHRDADVDHGRPVLAAGEDVAVGELVRERMGGPIVDRLVDPLLGGVYAGRADDLSVAVTMPGLAAELHESNTLQEAVARTLSRRAPAAGSPFATIDGGLSRFVDAIAAAMPSVRIRTEAPVRALTREGTMWRLTVGPARSPETVEADAVVLALPSRPAARLLDGVSRPVAVDVGVLDYASIGLVTYVLPPGALDASALADRSGALIPAVEGHLAKAITVFSSKWAPQDDGAVLLRASVGRYGEEASLAYDDESLISLVHQDLSKIVGVPLPPPRAAQARRWGGALPQYLPGHLDRVTRARAALPDMVALAGAAFDGVGIPACVRSGERAAEQIVAAVGGITEGEWAHEQ